LAFDKGRSSEITNSSLFVPKRRPNIAACMIQESH